MCICVFNIPCYVSFGDKKNNEVLKSHIPYSISYNNRTTSKRHKKNEMDITSINNV